MQSPDGFLSVLQEWIEVSTRVSMRNLIRHARGKGFSIPQLGALYQINRKGCNVSVLGEHLGVTSAAASQLLEHLVRQGLISRVEDPADRRVKQLGLTDKGQQALRESIQAREGWIEDLAKSMTDSEKEQIHQALTILVAKVKLLG